MGPKNMFGWHIKVEVWPYFTGTTREENEQACGGKLHEFELDRCSFDEMVARAALIITGIKTNPRVWQAQVISAVKT